MTILSLLLAAFTVSLPPRPSACEKTAADELVHFLDERLSGGEALTVAGSDEVVFHVGDTDLARTNGLTGATLKDEEWVVRSFGGDVVLNGGGRGVLYAVYHFLEDDCGIGFFGNDDTEIPSGPLAVGKIDRRGRPHFRYRCIHRGMVKNMHPEFVARRRLNSNSELGVIPAAFGGDVTYGSPNHVHTYDSYLPEAKYFKEHPEYYALKEGVRWPGKTGQLCLANPDVRRILKEGLLDNIAKGEAKAKKEGQPPPRFYELSMNDNWRRCECEACTAECEKYNPSGQQIRLMNELAAAIKDKHPYVVLTTLAYFYSEPPPKGGVKAADNVLVKLCDTRTNSASGIREDENGFFRELVEGWRKCVGEFIVWDYAIIYDERTQSFPFPNENTFKDFFRYMADQRAYGFFIEQEKCDVSDQYELKFYLQSQLMEDPYANVKDLYWTFMNRYYGKAAASVHDARRRLAKSAQERHAYIDWLANVGAFDFLSEEDVAFMRTCYDQAEKAVAGDPRRLARVRKSRRGVDDLSRIQAEAPKPNRDGVFVLEGDLIALPSRNAVARVDDPDSPSGMAVRCLTDESKGRYFDPPVIWGMYDVSKKTTLESGRIEIPSGREYLWHDLGEHTFPGSGYMYFTRGWPVQICPAFPGIAGKRFNVRALIRFVGPVYHPGETGKSWIDFARFELSPVTSDPK